MCVIWGFTVFSVENNVYANSASHFPILIVAGHFPEHDGPQQDRIAELQNIRKRTFPCEIFMIYNHRGNINNLFRFVLTRQTDRPLAEAGLDLKLRGMHVM